MCAARTEERLIRRFSSRWLVVAFALLAGVATCRADNIDDLRRRGQASAARILAYTPGGVARGSGLLISSEGEVLTAYHVVYQATRIEITIDGRRYVNVSVSYVRPGSDMAVLKIEGAPSVAEFFKPAPSDWQGRAGENIYVLGYPRGLIRTQLLGGSLTQDGYTPSQEWFDDSGNGIFVVRDLSLLPLDLNTEDGLSGGPVIDGQGRLVGIISGSVRRGRAYAWAIPVAELNKTRMLKIERAAQALRDNWPAFSFVAAGASPLRRFVVSTSEVGQYLRECRQKIRDYRDALDNLFASAAKLASVDDIMNRQLAAIEGVPFRNAAVDLNTLGQLFAAMAPAYDEALNRARSLGALGGPLQISCLGNAEPILEKYEALFNSQFDDASGKKWLRRIAALKSSTAELDRRTRAATTAVVIADERATLVNAQAAPARRLQALIRIIRYYENLGRILRSNETRQTAADLTDTLEEFASLMEGVELARLDVSGR
jgi:hypothetical protein